MPCARFSEIALTLKSEMIHFDRIINLLEKTEDVPIGFDPAIWRLVVRKVMVGKDSVRFIMAGDSETIIRIMKL